MAYDNFNTYDEDHDGYLNEEEFLKYAKVNALEFEAKFCPHQTEPLDQSKYDE